MRFGKRRMRTHYFIDAGYQAGFIVKFCALIMCASLLIGALIYYFNRSTTTVAFENLKVVVKSTADFILPIMIQIIITVTILVGLATIAVTLFASHKIAGPLYRLKVELEKIKTGDFSTPIRIRSKDQLQKLASEFDEMRVGIKDSIGLVKESWISVKTYLYMLEKDIKDDKEKDRINSNIEKIDSELARFKTG